MLYVYAGYVSPDNYDASERPCYELKEFRTTGEVLSFKKEFDENIHSECSNVIFKVIDGRERQIVAKEVVTEYEIKS